MVSHRVPYLGPLLFLIFFNDIIDIIENSKILIYADDTVLYFSSKDILDIEKKLNSDLQALSTWLDNNDLVANLKKGKTECMLFGTPQRIAKQESTELNVTFKNSRVNSTTSYKYLGVELNNHLNMNIQFERNYKRFSSRLRLLSKLRPLLTKKSTLAIYSSMLVPIVTYCTVP